MYAFYRDIFAIKMADSQHKYAFIEGALSQKVSTSLSSVSTYVVTYMNG